MADNYGYDSAWRYQVEGTYGTADGNTTGYSPIIEGGDGLVRTVDSAPRRAISGRGIHATQQVRDAAAGTHGTEFNIDGNISGGLLACALGGVESDGSGPYDTYLFIDNLGAQTVGATGGYSHIPSVSMQIYRSTVKYTYAGSMVNSATIRMSNGGIMELDVDMLAKTEARATNGDSPFTFASFAPVKQSYLTAATVGGENILNQIRSFEITINNNLDGDHWPLGVTGRGQPKRRGPVEVTGSVELEWDDEVYEATTPDGILQEWYGDTSSALTLDFDNGDSGTSERGMRIYLPSVKFVGNPPTVDQPGVLTVTCEFMALDATVAANALGSGEASGAHGQIVHCPIGIRITNNTDISSLFD